jgi:hypothetical protein
MLALKLLLTPLLIALATWIGRRFGPTVGGWFAALPLTSGPVLLVLALERGTAFAADAATGTLLALVSLSAYAIVYAYSAPHTNWIGSTVLAWTAYLACTWLLQSIVWPPLLVFPLVCLVLLLAIPMLPASPTGRSTVVAPLWDVPSRMVLAATLVYTLSRVAEALGPRLSGLLTPLPIAATILTAFAHHLDGAATASALLRGLLVGLFSFATCFLVLALMLESHGVTVAFVSAAIATLAVHAGIWLLFVSATSTRPRTAPIAGAMRD